VGYYTREYGIGNEDLPKIKEQLFGNSPEADASMAEFFLINFYKILVLV